MKLRLSQTADSFKQYLIYRCQIKIKKLAAEMGLSETAMHNILNGKVNRPGDDRLNFLAKVSGLSWDTDAEGIYFTDEISRPAAEAPRTEPYTVDELAEMLMQLDDVEKLEMLDRLMDQLLRKQRSK